MGAACHPAPSHTVLKRSLPRRWPLSLQAAVHDASEQLRESHAAAEQERREERLSGDSPQGANDAKDGTALKDKPASRLRAAFHKAAHLPEAARLPARLEADRVAEEAEAERSLVM